MLTKNDEKAVEERGDGESAAAGGGEYTVDEAIEHCGLGAFTWLNVALCGTYWAADAMELMLMSYLLPAVAARDAFDLGSASEAMLAAVVFAGIALGTLACGAAADRVGRRAVVCGSVLLSGALGCASAAAPNVGALLALRFALGLALGGAPVAFGLLAELLPSVARGRTMVWFNLFWTAGTLLEAACAYWLLPRFGWRWLLVASSVPCLLVGVAALFLLVESPRYLMARGERLCAEAVLLTAARLNGVAPLRGRLVLARAAPPPRASATARRLGRLAPLYETYRALRSLLSPSLRRVTLTLWLVWATNSFAYYGLVLFTNDYFDSVRLARLLISKAAVSTRFSRQAERKCGRTKRHVDQLFH